MTDTATSTKKPIYKRWWFILGAIVLVLAALGSPDESTSITATTGAVAGEATTDAVAGEMEEDYLMRDGDFALLELDSSRGQFGNLIITGAVKNLSSREKGYVQVEINLLDNSGAIVGSTLANVNNMAGGQTWRFEAPALQDNAARFEVKAITGF